MCDDVKIQKDRLERRFGCWKTQECDVEELLGNDWIKI